MTGPRISIGNHWVPTGATSELPRYSKGKPDSSWCDVSRSARREGSGYCLIMTMLWMCFLMIRSAMNTGGYLIRTSRDRTSLSLVKDWKRDSLATLCHVAVVTSRLHSSYERGCQEKTSPAPREDAGVVTCIQPHLMLRGVVGLAALARRRFQRRRQPQLLVPTQRFHKTVALDAIRFRSYAS